jgi:gluconokinase
VGATRPGQFALTLGTHAVVRTVSAHSPEHARRFYGLPIDRHVIGGNALWGGRAADWFLDLYAQPNRAKAFADVDHQAQDIDIGADGALFLPYLGGRNAPDQNFAARAAFLNLNLGHSKAHLYRALLEGVAFALAEILEQVEGWCGQAPSLRLTGGGAASAVWRTILCTVLDRPLDYSDTAAETRGAAIFAAVATGHYPDYDRAADAMALQRGRLEPARGDVARYQDIYARWRAARDASEAPLAAQPSD